MQASDAGHGDLEGPVHNPRRRRTDSGNLRHRRLQTRGGGGGVSTSSTAASATQIFTRSATIGAFRFFPIVPGHEIVGRVAEVGDNVNKWKKGDIVGPGCSTY
jgi:hypothetical protein